MSEEEFEQVLMAILDNFVDEDQDDDENPDHEPIKSLLTFDDAGLLTRDRGIVICFGDGTEFQLTIRQSR